MCILDDLYEYPSTDTMVMGFLGIKPRVAPKRPKYQSPDQPDLFSQRPAQQQPRENPYTELMAMFPQGTIH